MFIPLRSRAVSAALLQVSAGALLLLAAAACSRADASRPDHPERLDGAWTVELRLEQPATLTRDTLGVPPVRGTVVLLENERVRGAAGLSGAPTHVGVYSADLAPLALRSGGEVPTLVARMAAGDSVEIAFDPARGHPFVGRGVLAGDSVTGHWWAGGGRTAGRSSCRFVMRRA